ncbi:MAG: DEAD/DEAH box helicase family protein [Lachnoclostridium sp.]|nr:DEAD/DEAH box helicase family protein [Lachnoclostridium sp.]
MINVNKPRYISELIDDDYKKWENEFVIFDAPTNTGKTYFTLNILSQYALKKKRKVLYLCNRSQLRKDIERAVQNLKYTHVTVLSYQTLQQCLLNGDEFVDYGYIIFDEVHYFISDSFNGYTDVAYQFLMQQTNNVCLLMSATAITLFNSLLMTRKVRRERYYSIEKDYSFVQHVYLYNGKALPQIIDSILEENPTDKVLVFCNAGRRLIEMHSIYKEMADYFCSTQNCKQKELLEICTEQPIQHISDVLITFNKRILFTTKVLDNGIDLKDESIKHIITEIFDIDSMIQSLGRKRSLHLGDTCNLYIKEYTPQGIRCFQNNIQRQLGPVQLLKDSPEEFLKEYGGGKNRKNLKDLECLNIKFEMELHNGVVGGVDINEMRYQKLLFDYEVVSQMEEYGYFTSISIWLGSKLNSKMERLEVSPMQKNMFLEYLESINDKRLFRDDRTVLKAEFEKIGLKDRTMGIHTLNGKLKDKKYPYRIFRTKDQRKLLDDGSPNPNIKKWYWTIKKIE